MASGRLCNETFFIMVGYGNGYSRPVWQLSTLDYELLAINCMLLLLLSHGIWLLNLFSTSS